MADDVYTDGKLTYRLPEEASPRSFPAIPFNPGADPETEARHFLIADTMHGGVRFVTVGPGSPESVAPTVSAPLTTATTADINAAVQEAVAAAMAAHAAAQTG